jgi:hypothetical protein
MSARSDRLFTSATGTIFIDLGFSGGPLFVGFVAASIGIPAAFGAAAIVALTGAAATLLASSRGAPEAARSA